MLCFQDCHVPLPCDILCLQLALLDLLSDSGQHLWPQLVLNSLPQILETIVDNSDSMEALPTTKQVYVFFVFSCWCYLWVFHSVWFGNNWNLIAMTSLTWIWFVNVQTWIYLFPKSVELETHNHFKSIQKNHPQIFTRVSHICFLHIFIYSPLL